MTTKTKKAQTQSKFYVVKTAKEAQKKIEDKVKTYNEKVKAYDKAFVKKQISDGKEFITELKNNPKKRIDALIDDSKNAIEKTRKEQYTAWEKTIKNARSDAKNRFEKLNAEGKKVYKGVENDVRLIIEDVIKISKKNIDKMPMKKDIEDRFFKGIESIPSKLNIPSRDEIDNLAKGIKNVNKKVDELSKKVVNA